MKIIKRQHVITSERVPESFDGFKIMQISDVHSADVAAEIISQIENPDIIVITGDLIDGRVPNYTGVGLLKQLSTIAPVYYITGNHEATYLEQYDLIVKHVDAYVNILHDEKIVLKRGSDKLNIIGLDDLKYHHVLYGRDNCLPDDRLQNFNMDDYSIVLLHSPNNFDYISQYNPDLILSGHTHGGQFRIPLIGALYAPGQGLFPKIDKGYFECNNSKLIVSAGIGYSRINLRLFCPSEINEIVLQKKR